MAATNSSVLSAMAVPGYRRLWLVGLLVNLTRWMTIFLSSYLINDLTHSVLLVQLVGVCVFAPMFLGGIVAGVFSDRIDRLRPTLVALSVLMPAAVGMAFLNLSDLIEVYMVYPFVLAVGMGHVIDMTSRRALVYDVVGPGLITNALALESMAMTSGAVVGGLTAGAVISLLGVGEVFLIMAVLYLTALVLFLNTGILTHKARAPSAVGFLEDLSTGLRYVKDSRPLVSVLGVTVVMNLFYFSFMPLIPIFGERLGVSAFLSGLLLSAHGLGSVVGAAAIARGLSVGRGQIYIGGSAVALTFLFLFSASPWYPAALLCLLAAGSGIAGFATMQSVLVMISSDDAMRGRAMGILSMSIGVLPFSMALLGIYAGAVGASMGVMTSVTLGLLALAIFSTRRPEARQLA